VNRRLRTLFAAALFLFCAGAAHSFNVIFEGGVDNAFFPPDVKAPLQPGYIGPFTPSLTVVGRGGVEGTWAQRLFFSLFYKIDPIWKHTMQGDAAIRLGVFTLGLGAYWGIIDQDYTKLTPGVSGRFGITVPGAFFIDAKIMASVNTNDDLKTEARSGQIYSAGIWFPHIKLSAAYENLLYKDTRTDDRIIDTGRMAIRGRLAFYAKPFSFTIYIEPSYAELTREFTDKTSNTSAKDSYIQVMAALGLELEISRYFSFGIRAEAGSNGVELTDALAFTNITFAGTACITIKIEE
jgi:hypothetical protein